MIVKELKVIVCLKSGKGVVWVECCVGCVFGVIYGNNQFFVMILIEDCELCQCIFVGWFLIMLVDIDFEGKKYCVILCDYYFDLVRDFLIYVDFMWFGEGVIICISVLLYVVKVEIFLGVKCGGMVNIVVYVIEFECGVESIL